MWRGKCRTSTRHWTGRLPTRTGGRHRRDSKRATTSGGWPGSASSCRKTPYGEIWPATGTRPELLVASGRINEPQIPPTRLFFRASPSSAQGISADEDRRPGPRTSLPGNRTVTQPVDAVRSPAGGEMSNGQNTLIRLVCLGTRVREQRSRCRS